jgi:hypothetical protein
MDISDTIRSGQKNMVAARLHTNDQPVQMSGGFVSRLLLYSPNQ